VAFLSRNLNPRRECGCVAQHTFGRGGLVFTTNSVTVPCIESAHRSALWLSR
jgi:hypothetical protein